MRCDLPLDIFWIIDLTTSAADKREFLKISQAVGTYSPNATILGDSGR